MSARTARVPGATKEGERGRATSPVCSAGHPIVRPSVLPLSIESSAAAVPNRGFRLGLGSTLVVDLQERIKERVLLLRRLLL